MGAIFQNLGPNVTLKMGSRSSKCNQFLSLSQQYSCTSLVKIHPFILEIGCRKKHFTTIHPFLHEIGCRQAIFQQSKLLCDLENGVKVTKI